MHHFLLKFPPRCWPCQGSLQFSLFQTSLFRYSSPSLLSLTFLFVMYSFTMSTDLSGGSTRWSTSLTCIALSLWSNYTHWGYFLHPLTSPYYHIHYQMVLSHLCGEYQKYSTVYCTVLYIKQIISPSCIQKCVHKNHTKYTAYIFPVSKLSQPLSLDWKTVQYCTPISLL